MTCTHRQYVTAERGTPTGSFHRVYETTCKGCGKLLVKHRVTPYDFGRKTP